MYYDAWASDDMIIFAGIDIMMNFKCRGYFVKFVFSVCDDLLESDTVLWFTRDIIHVPPAETDQFNDHRFIRIHVPLTYDGVYFVF